MTDTTYQDEGEDRGEPQAKPTATFDAGADDTAEIMSPVQQRRDMVPVGRGVNPQTLAQMVEFAGAMTRGTYALPQYLLNNVGDCLFIVNTALSHGMDPFLLGQLTYVQQGRIGFMAQAYHALLLTSKVLRGTLEYEYNGEGDEMTCTITGYVKGDPRPKKYTSPKLKDARPPMGPKFDKNKGPVKDKDGNPIMVRKGSPLWDRDAPQQLGYYTVRAWVRMHTPHAVLGVIQYEDAADLNREIEGEPLAPLGTRLAGDRVQGGGGFPGAAAVRQSLSQVAPNAGEKWTGEEAADAQEGSAEASQASPKPKPGPRQPKAMKTHQRGSKQPAKATADKRVKDAADRAENAAAAKKAAVDKAIAKEVPAKGAPARPTNTASYMQYLTSWLENAVEAEQVVARWTAESDLRQDCGLPLKTRQELRRGPVEATVKRLRGQRE